MFIVVGLNHKKGSAEVRERLSALPAALVLEKLKEEGWPEAVVLSTCNRFEVYAASDKAGSARALGDFLLRLSGSQSPVEGYAHEELEAVRHLFSVASGLDSLVVGEAEVLGQVKQAYEAAQAAQMTRKSTNVLFQRALYAGKLARTQTGIASGQTSVASVAVQLAERIFGNLSQCRVLILGAGKMAELTARHTLGRKAAELYVANRTWEKAEELGRRFGARPVSWEDFPRLLEKVDVVIASTGSVEPVVTVEMVRGAVRARQGRSLFFIDIAMPRDVEEGVHSLPQVYHYRLEDLKGIVEENLSRRQEELKQAKELVDSKAREFLDWHRNSEQGKKGGLSHV